MQVKGFLLTLGLGMAAGGAVALVFPGLVWLQVAVALATAVATLFLLRPTILEKVRRAPGYRSSLDTLIGASGVTTTAITAHAGEVKVDGGEYLVMREEDVMAVIEK